MTDVWIKSDSQGCPQLDGGSCLDCEGKLCCQQDAQQPEAAGSSWSCILTRRNKIEMKLDQVNWKLSLNIFRRRALTQPAHHPRWLCGRWEPRRSSPWCAGSLQRRWDHFKYREGEDARVCDQSLAIIDELSLDDGKPPETGSNNLN